MVTPFSIEGASSKSGAVQELRMRAKSSRDVGRSAQESRLSRTLTVLGILATLLACVIAVLAYRQQLESDRKQLSRVNVHVGPSKEIGPFPTEVRLSFVNRGPAVAKFISAEYECPSIGWAKRTPCELFIEALPGGVDLDVQRVPGYLGRYTIGIKQLPPDTGVSLIVRTPQIEPIPRDNIEDALAKPHAARTYLGVVELFGENVDFQVSGAVHFKKRPD